MPQIALQQPNNQWAFLDVQDAQGAWAVITDSGAPNGALLVPQPNGGWVLLGTRTDGLVTTLCVIGGL